MLGPILSHQASQCLFAFETLWDGGSLPRDFCIALLSHLGRLVHPLILDDSADLIRW